MGVFSEMDMEQFENDELSPFQMDSPRPNAVEWTAPPQQPNQAAAAATSSKLAAEPQPDDPDSVSSVSEEESTTEELSEEAKRKAHEEAEAKRKAEWEETQAAKKAAEQKKLQQIAGMSDDEVMMESTRRVSADTEKITRRNMKDCVSEIIQTKCLEDPAFARLVMHPHKSMINCFKYITRRAWEYVQDEIKVDRITPGAEAQGYGCDIPDDLCYQWAEDYFRDPCVKEDQQTEEKFVPKPYTSTTSSKTAKKKTAKGRTSKKSEKKAKPDKPPASDQISLLDMDMLEVAS